MFQRLIRNVFGGAAEAPVSEARTGGFGRRAATPRLQELLAIPSPELRDVFAARARNEGPEGWADEELNAVVVTAFANDPITLAIELFIRAPLALDYTRSVSEPGAQRLEQAYQRALDHGALRCHADYADAWPIPPQRLEPALLAVGAAIAQGAYGGYGHGSDGYFRTIVAAGAARAHEPAIRRALIQLFDTAIGENATTYNNAAAVIDRLVALSGIARGDVPGFVAIDRRAARLDAIRAAILADAGEPLGAAIAAVLDQEKDTNSYTLRDFERHPAVRAVANLSPEARGAAFNQLLTIIKGLPLRGIERWGELERSAGVYRVGVRYTRHLAGLGRLLATLASRKMTLADADADCARFLELLADFPHLRSKRIVDLLTATARAHPRGKTVDGLRALFGPNISYNPLSDWAVEVEEALRDIAAVIATTPAPAEAAPRATVPVTGFGRKRADGGAPAPQTAGILPGLPPIAPLNLRVGRWDERARLATHFANPFEARLYDQPNQAQLAALVALGEQIAALPADMPRRWEQIVSLARRSPLQCDPDNDGHRNARCVEMLVEEATEIARRMAGFGAPVTADPEVARGLGKLAAAIAGKSAPPASWLKEGKALVAAIPAERRLAMLDALIAGPSPSSASPASEPYLRTLLYLSTDLDPGTVGPKLTEYALKSCYVTLKDHGIRAEKLGNACLWTLAALPDGAGIPYLARILARTKYPKIRAKIDATLNAAAEAAGMDRATLDEITVPTHGLDRDGALRMPLGDGEAVIRIAGSRDTEIEWLTGAGKAVKAPTAAMKADKAAIKEVREAAKEIEADLSTLATRLQRQYLEDRSWDAETWRERYLDHPLVRPLASRLIWWVEQADGARVAGLAAGDGLADVAGRAIALDGATIRPWHPIDAEPADVEAWRDRIEALQVTQPFAQAWREVYAITDAERATGTYTLRWAAHLLRQHQAMTLARLNGWRVTHRMWVDAPNDEAWHLAIPAHGVVADYWVSGSGGDDPQVLDSGAYVYVATDRVQFHAIAADASDSARGPARGRAVALADLPPIVFSEVMRHADLLTAVASIAADPQWLDRGADAAHPSQWDRDADAYWQRTNTADLAESGKRRLALLKRIVPRLAIADKLRLDDQHLVVEGTRHRYRIHLGSGACFRGERHICIVPDVNRVGEGRVWLPFEGDRTLSIILAKAVLLANDAKITDPVILRQL